MQPGDRLVCALLEDLKVGDQFKTWPLHVTIVPWFRLADDSASVVAGLSKALHDISPFELVGDGEAMFGPRSRKVRLLAPNQSLSAVEAKVRAYLHKKRAWIVDETTKRHYEFRPHVTAQADSGLGRAAKFTVDRLFIIEQKGVFKEVASEVVL